MACNPALCAGSDGVAAPVPFTGEQLLLSRDGVEFELDGLECVMRSTCSLRHSAAG
jgi:hypothetical protein